MNGDGLRGVEYGRKPTCKEVRDFAKLFPTPRMRRYYPWCDNRNINQALMKDALDELRSQTKKTTHSENSSSRSFPRRKVEIKLKDQSGMCACCGVKLILSDACGDHIIPHSRGGPTTKWNLQVLCSDCNSAKSDKDPMLWAHKNKVGLSDEFIRKYYTGAVDTSSYQRIWRFTT